MSSARQYWNAFKTARNDIAVRMGSDASMTPTDVRVVDNANLAAVAILAKALTDKGVLTDADLQAARDAALADAWDAEPPLP